MNFFNVDTDDFAEVVSLSKLLESWVLPNDMTLHVAEYAGGDWLFLEHTSTGGAVLIDPDDAANGGSYHDHLRDAKRYGTR